MVAIMVTIILTHGNKLERPQKKYTKKSRTEILN
jgi:hypothetical protein